jgi:hypothetical protein
MIRAAARSPFHQRAADRPKAGSSITGNCQTATPTHHSKGVTKVFFYIFAI